MPSVHPTAIVSEQAHLGENVTIGPYSVIEADVEIGAGTSIGAYTVVHPHTIIGADNRIHSHVVLGDLPQHQAYKMGTQSSLIIVNNNVIREMVVVHRAFYPNAETRVGSHGFFMSNSHVAHDCIVGDHVVITNNSVLGGHVEVGDHAMIGGLVGVHQFARVGAYSMVAAATLVRKDVLPYSMLGGESARHYRLNTVGLRRNGVSGERYRVLERAFRALRDGNRDIEGDTEEISFLQQWLAQPSKRGLAGFHKRD